MKVRTETYYDLTEALHNVINVGILDLRNKALTTLPKEIGQLKNLEILYLERNNFSSQEQKKICKLLPKCKMYWN